MGRPKKSAPKHVEPEDEVQESYEEEPAVVIEPEEEDEPVAAQPSMSKADACRAALAAGIEKAEEAMEFTRNKFGVEIKATDFFLYKSKAKTAAAAAPAKRGRKPKAAEPPVTKPPTNGHVAPPAKQPSDGSQADLLESLETLKPLIASMGAEKIKRLVDLLG